MSYLQFIGAIVVGFVSFAAGWLAATEKMRIELFRARLDAYRGICKSFATVLMLEVKIPSSAESKESLIALGNAKIAFIDAKHELTKELLAAGTLVSPRLMKEIVSYTKTDLAGENIWHSYVNILNEMAVDLGLKGSFRINESLLNPVEALRGVMRRGKD